MRIPTREEQARYGNLNAHDTQRFNVQERTPNMQLQINADMFGAGQARAMGQGAHELQRGARQIAHWYNKNEEVKGEDNYNKLLQEANEGLYGKEGILMQKGAAGKDAAVNAEKFLTSLSDKYLQGLSDVAQQSFMDRTQRFANHTMTRAHVHAAEEDRANTINIHDASMASAKDNALRNAANPEAFNDYAAQYMQALTLKEQVLGSPQEKIDMKRKEGLSGLYMDKVQGLIVGGDLKGARAAVNVGGMLEQDKMRALGVIKQEEKRLQAEARANAAEARVGIIVGETDNMYQQFGGDIESGYAYIREKYAHDPRMRLEVESSFSGRVRMEEAAASKTQQLRLNEIKNSSIDAIGAQDATPASVSKVIAEAPPELQPVLASAARMRFPSQEVVVSDAGKLSEAKAAILTGEIKDEKQLRQDYMPYIASNELEKLEQSVSKNKDNASATSLRASFNTTMREYDIENLASSADMTPAAYMGATWYAFVDEAFDRNLTTPQEKRQFMQEYLRRVSLSKERTMKGIPYWFDSKKEVPEFAARALRSEGYAEQEPQRPERLPAEAVWGSAKAGWIYNNKFLPAAKVVR